MAAGGASSVEVQRFPKGFRTALASAVLEWLLIFLLFVEAIFSYLVTKFSRHCKLQIPCLLCSRLDHVLGDEKPGFYKNLICRAHKSEISSLVHCHIHDKLVDVHEMCEVCLFSYATENKSNAETYRLLVGKLGMVTDHSVDEHPLLSDPSPDYFGTRLCSCCNNPWAMRSSTTRFLQTKLIAPELGEHDVLSLVPAENDNFLYQCGVQKGRDTPSALLQASNQGSHRIDPLSHFGYSELKVTSDTESEVPLSDEDDASALAGEPDDLKNDLTPQYAQLETQPSSPEILSKNVSADFTLEKMSHEASTSDHSVLIPSMQLEVDEPEIVASSAPDVAIGHGLEELNWHQVKEGGSPSKPCELILLDDNSVSTCAMEAPVEVVEDTCKFSLDDIPASTCATEALGVPGDNPDALGTSDTGHTSATESGEVCKPGNELTMTSGLDLKVGQVSSDYIPLLPKSLSDAYKLAVGNKASQASDQLAEQLSGMDTARFSEDLKLFLSHLSSVRGLELSGNDIVPRVHGNDDELKTSDSSSSIGVYYSPRLLNSLSDAYKLAVANKGNQASGWLAEQLSGMDSTRVSEDPKLLLSRVSSFRGVELSGNDMGPKVQGNGDELKVSDSPSSIGMQILQRKISLERNESGFESLDGSIVSEIEGESVVDRLKRQVEYDRKSMGALYRELEEERNAAAVAANQALAMITRLQEEKAALHMEALQYLRMMEEQSEYDVEALQKANDLLAEREKQIQDLETELEYNGGNSPDKSMFEKVQEATSDMRRVDMRMKHSEPSGIETDADIPCSSPYTRESGSSDIPVGTKDVSILKNSILDFEDERLYISQCLKKLEKRLHLFSDNWVYVDVPNGVYSAKDTHEINDLEEIHENELAQETSDLADKERLSPPLRNFITGDKENDHITSDKLDSTMDDGVHGLESVRNEVSVLNERLAALEADRNFLERAVHSLRNGDEGLKFIQEIAKHLGELRKIGMKSIEQAIV